MVKVVQQNIVISISSTVLFYFEKCLTWVTNKCTITLKKGEIKKLIHDKFENYKTTVIY